MAKKKTTKKKTTKKKTTTAKSAASKAVISASNSVKSQQGAYNADAKSSMAAAKNAAKTLQKQASTAVAAMKNPKLDTSNPFAFITDKNAIQAALDQAVTSAYDVKKQEANQALSRAEDTSYANTQEAMRGLRNTMSGSAATGSNRGAAGANAIQALLGLGQQNNALVTEQLQNINNIVSEKAAAMAQNAADAIDKSNAAKEQQGTLATQRYSTDSDREASRYTADQNYRSAAATALGALTGSMHTDAYNREMNNATNATNVNIANTTQKTSNVNKNTSKETVKSKNVNINKNK